MNGLKVFGIYKRIIKIKNTDVTFNIFLHNSELKCADKIKYSIAPPSSIFIGSKLKVIRIRLIQAQVKTY